MGGLGPQRCACAVENVLADAGILGVRLEHRLRDIDRFDEALGTEIVERELVADGGVGLVAVCPRVLVVLGRALVRLLLLHDVAHVLPRACARLVVQQNLLEDRLREVRLGALDVDVRHQQPRPLEVLGKRHVPGRVGDLLQHRAGLGALLQQHVAAGHAQQRRHVRILGDRRQVVDCALHVRLVVGRQQHIIAKDRILLCGRLAALRKLGQQLLGRAHAHGGRLAVARGLKDLAAQRAVLGVQTDLDHRVERTDTPVGILARQVEVLEGRVGLVRVPLVEAVAVVQAGLGRGVRGRLLRHFKELRAGLQLAGAAQEVDEA
eukprot:m.233871 g.233871  ORF g.233871 m.233871 type:complete len:321 (-) comp12582_c0_seq1:3008-3970(-)